MVPPIPVSLMFLGALGSAAGTFYSARTKRTELNLQADLSEIAARGELRRGERAEQQLRLQTAWTKGAQRAALAANGVDLSSTSAAEILTSTDVMGEIDAETIQANALRAAWGHRAQGEMSRASARGISPLLSAGSTLLGGATQAATSWYMLNKVGAGGDGPSIFDEPLYGFGRK